jgi:hypothetical protein
MCLYGWVLGSQRPALYRSCERLSGALVDNAPKPSARSWPLDANPVKPFVKTITS